MKNPANVVAAIGLALGGVFGLVGTVVTQQNLRAASWGIDGVGLVVATSLLALRFLRKGNDYVAAGFLVFAIGEGVIAFRDGGDPYRKRSFVCRGHGLMVCGASAHECSQGIRPLDSSGRHY